MRFHDCLWWIATKPIWGGSFESVAVTRTAETTGLEGLLQGESAPPSLIASGSADGSATLRSGVRTAALNSRQYRRRHVGGSGLTDGEPILVEVASDGSVASERWGHSDVLRDDAGDSTTGTAPELRRYFPNVYGALEGIYNITAKTFSVPSPGRSIYIYIYIYKIIW